MVSANVGILVAEQSPLVKQSTAKALELAQGALEGRIDGTNLPVLIRELLVAVAWKELDLEDDADVVTAASRILRAA